MSPLPVLGAGSAGPGATGPSGNSATSGAGPSNPAAAAASPGAFRSLLAGSQPPGATEVALSPSQPMACLSALGRGALAALERPVSLGGALGRSLERSFAIKSPRGVSSSDEDPVDPLRRHRAALQVPAMLTACTASPPSTLAPISAAPAADRALAAVSLEELLPALVRRVAWSGDGTRGTARLEIGAGELAGATLVVAADAGRVRVHLEVPAGVDTAAWQDRIRRQLESRRIVADSVEVA
jgi:hypothetical protein